MQIQRNTYVIFGVVLLTTVFSFSTQSGQRPKKPTTPQDSSSKAQESRLSFPAADYQEKEPVDPIQRAKRKEKQKRYDNFHQVMRDPDPNDAEIAVLMDHGPQLPPLPTDQSKAIIVGVVESVEAHLSENKKNVYSEFTVRIKDVLKSDTSLRPDSLMTIDRQGGFVKYPNGQQVLYRFVGHTMPRVGERYVFFLEHVAEDYRILTAYELSEKGITPLDELEQFQGFRGRDETTLLNTLRDSLGRPTPHQEQ